MLHIDELDPKNDSISNGASLPGGCEQVNLELNKIFTSTLKQIN
jgi:hypothetical protein